MSRSSGGARFVEAKCSHCGWEGKLHRRGVDACPRCGEEIAQNNIRPAVPRGTPVPFSWRLAGMVALTVIAMVAGGLGTIAVWLSAGALPGAALLAATIAATAGLLALHRPLAGWPWRSVWLRGSSDNVGDMIAQSIDDAP